MKCDELKLGEFLRDELDPSENHEILTHLDECKTCRERIRVMAILETNLQEETRPKRPRRWIYLAAAAVLTSMLIPIALEFSGTPPVKVEDEFSDPGPYPYFPLELRSQGPPSNDSSKERVEEAFAAYLAGDFRKANSILKAIVEKQNSPELIFYLGVTHYLLGNTELAQGCFRENFRHPRWKDASKWYVANLLLKRGENSAAIQLLQELQSEEGEFSDESSEILRRLKP